MPRLSELGEYVRIPALNEKEWAPISLAKYFEFKRGRESNMATLNEGKIPLVSAKSVNNGVKAFVNTARDTVAGNCITLNNDGDGGAGLAFYQPAAMALDTHVTALIPKSQMSCHALLFISRCISGLHGFFGHGLSISTTRAKRLRVMLPITDSGEPDYDYMEQYVKNMMLRKYHAYLDFIERESASIERERERERVSDALASLTEKSWREFSLDDIFTVKAGKRLETRNKIPGTRPFIGATDNGNGVTGFVGNDNASRDRNVLGVNYNGAPCIAFYHPYECLFTDDVKRLHLREHSDNKLALLFFVSVFAQQRSKYSYGYKFKEQRMLRQKLMLPVDDSGNPDYEYMEQYAMSLMLQKRGQYLAYLGC